MAPFQVLIFSRTAWYRHESIPAGIAAFQRMADEPDAPFSITATEDPTIFTVKNLAQYRVIVFLQSSGEFFDNDEQLQALKDFVHNGGGVFGVHCASTGLPSSDWYGKLIGGQFTEHPDPQMGKIVIEDGGHPTMVESTQGRPTEGLSEWEWKDEWYEFKTHPRANKNLHILMTVKEDSYEGGKLGDDHPIAWCQEFEGSRSAYNSLGHYDEAYEDPRFFDQLRNGILWVAKAI